jgi:hypothetical protein
MPTYQKLVQQFKPVAGSNPDRDFIHATLAGFPDRLHELHLAVESLIRQVDTLHVFLNEFTVIPAFLEHDKIFLTRSQDFGKLGECGKYYWTDDLGGYHFICSDRLIYPPDYAGSMIAKIEQHHRRAVVAAGGYQMKFPFTWFDESTIYFPETGVIPDDLTIPLVSDLALAYHSSTLRVSRHFFYQPELSDVWFSIIGLEQEVPFVLAGHDTGWIRTDGFPGKNQQLPDDTAGYRSFLVKSWFVPQEPGQSQVKSFNINDCFDRIYVINLDRRTDRWERMQRITERHQLNAIRFPAVDGYLEPCKSAWEKYSREPLQALPEGIEPLVDFKDKFLKYHHYVARVHFMESKLNRKAIQSPGAWGVSLSYIKIIKSAIESDFQRILIFEDDIILHKSFDHKVVQLFTTVPKTWKLVMLGAMQHYWDPWVTWVTDNSYNCHGSSTAAHATALDSKVFLQILFYAEKMDLPIDEGAFFHPKNVHPKNCFIGFPNLAIQRMEDSDINSSAMQVKDIENWRNRFRWNSDDYESLTE